jgi:formylglycine-generating enzyme
VGPADSQCEVEGEVLDLHHSITKAFSVAAFFGLALGQISPLSTAPTPPTGAAPASTAPPPLQTGSTPAPAPPDPSLGQQGPCDSEMLLVEGDYCPDAEQVCVKWLDPPPYQNLRCGEYAKPAKCKVPRQHRRFCVDREEYAEPAQLASVGGIADPKDTMPIVNKNWGEAKTLCEARGARLCKESEWEFACEGPEMSPYPYGWKRDSNLCNLDKTDLGGPMEKLKDLRAPQTAFPECKSPFGIHNMVGNVDEWVERENMAAPNRSALRGGWWLPGRNRCRAATTAHGEDYSGKQVGFRCCKDAPGAPNSAP